MHMYTTFDTPTQAPAYIPGPQSLGGAVAPLVDGAIHETGGETDVEARKRRVADAVMTGARVPSRDMRPNAGWFVQAHHGIYRALATARGLTGDQLRYLLCLLEYSLGLGFSYAVRDFKGTPATMPDWQAWLGGMNRTQVYRAKRALCNAGIILFLDGDPDRVAFNVNWETWRVRWDAATPGRNPRGRPAAAGAEQLALWPEPENQPAGAPGAEASVTGAPVQGRDAASPMRAARETATVAHQRVGAFPSARRTEFVPDTWTVATDVTTCVSMDVTREREAVSSPPTTPAPDAGLQPTAAATDDSADVSSDEDTPRFKRALCWPDAVIERMKVHRSYRMLSEDPYGRAVAFEDLDRWGHITLVCRDEGTRRRIAQDRAEIDEAWRDLYRDRRAHVVMMLVDAQLVDGQLMDAHAPRRSQE